MTDAFKQIGFQSGTGGGYGTSDIVSNQQNMSNQKDYLRFNNLSLRQQPVLIPLGVTSNT